MELVDKAFIGACLFIFAFGMYVLSLLVTVVAVEERCLEKGYREVLIDWNYKTYCAKRIQGTDVLIKVD